MKEQKVKKIPLFWIQVWISLGAQMVVSACSVGTWVQSLVWEDPLEKEMATHSRTLAWNIPWMEEPGRLQSIGSKRIIHN